MATLEVAETIFLYLTGVEGFKLVAQTFDKDLITVFSCAG
jgi:mercuric reductase